MRLRMLGALTLSLAVASGIAPLATAQAATVPHATPGSSPTEFYAASGDGYEIGNGITIDNTSPTVSVSSDLETVTASASGWQLSLTSSTALTPGTYTTGISVTDNGNTCSSGSFTIIEISASDVNATFSLDCGTTAAAPGTVGFVRYNATLATPVPSLPSSAEPITDPPNSGTTSANADEFYIVSAPGASLSWTGAQIYTGSSVQASGNSGSVTVTAGGLEGWTWSIAAPGDQQLVPGTYNATNPLTGTSGSISYFLDGTGCDTYYGSFTIYQIAYNAAGGITQLNASFAISCQQVTNPGLFGYVRYNATSPTPVPALLTAPVKASSGAADASENGQTDVTLAASGSNATAGASYSFDFGDGAAPTVSSSPVATKPEWEGTYDVVVTITDAGQTAVSTSQWLTVGDGYHAISPQRLIDTRANSQVGSYTGPIDAKQSISVALPSSVTDSGHGPVEAVVLNVTVTSPTAGGNIQVYSSGLLNTPTTSNVNFGKGQTVANLVTVSMVSGGDVVLSVQQNSGSVQLIADLEGYYTAGNDPTNSGYQALSSKRIVDTRSKTGGIGGRLSAWQKVRLALPSSVATGASAVALNVTAVNPSSFGDVKVYPDSSTLPNSSNLNFSKGDTVPNLVIVPVPANRVIDIYLDSDGSADLLVDLEGYYSTAATAKFVPSFPTRMFDTRTGEAGGMVKSGWEITSAMSEWLQVPSPALTAAMYNVTVTEPQGNGNIIVFPYTDTTLPSTSNVNFSKGQTVANAALGQLTSDGDQVFYNESYSSTQLISDFFGYFALPLSTTAPPAESDASQTAGKNVSTPSTRFLTKTQVLAKQ